MTTRVETDLILDETLVALAELDSSTGLMVQTGGDTFIKRSLVAPPAGLTITDPGGAAGAPTFALANDLAALEGLSSTGIPNRTGTDVWGQLVYTRSIYVPTFTAVLNVDTVVIAGSNARYIRLGNDVWVYGQLTLDPTADAVTTSFGISLPVPSNFVTTTSLIGFMSAAAINSSGRATGDTTNDRANFFLQAVGTGSNTYNFEFNYEIV